MSELDNLQKAEGKEEIKTKISKAKKKVKSDNTSLKEDIKEVTHEHAIIDMAPTVEIPKEEIQSTEIVNETSDSKKGKESKDKESNNDNDEVINEIEDSNAEDAEDEGHKDRHTIEVKDYESMSLDALSIELEKLVKNEKIQAIKSHVEQINNEFKSKFHILLEEKKEEFVSNGGHEMDFYYSSPVQKHFKDVYKTYKNKLHEHYKVKHFPNLQLVQYLLE